MSLVSNDLLATINSSKSETKSVRLATVTSVSDAGVYLQFYGEDTASQKAYKRLGSYTATVGDTVMLTAINNSWVITGKVV